MGKRIEVSRDGEVVEIVTIPDEDQWDFFTTDTGSPILRVYNVFPSGTRHEIPEQRRTYPKGTRIKQL